MNKYIITRISILFAVVILFNGCSIPKVTQRTENKNTPNTYGNNSKPTDTLNSAKISWRTFFTDSNLVHLIDTALVHNQELMITLQEIEIAKNDIRVKKGELLPTVNYGLEVGADKVGRYTSQGAGDEATEIKPGKKVPQILGDFKFGVDMEWEIDIWKKNNHYPVLNQWTNLLAEYGIWGIGVLLWLFVFWLKSLYLFTNSKNFRVMFWSGTTVFFGIFAFLGMLSSLYWRQSIYLQMLFVLVWVMSKINLTRKQHVSD